MILQASTIDLIVFCQGNHVLIVYINLFNLKFLISASTRMTFNQAKEFCGERKKKLASADQILNKVKRGPDGVVYWLPYSKKMLDHWTWINKKQFRFAFHH